jgi:WD40 repeat protein
MGEAVDRPALTAGLQRFLFGDDVFISYSRRHGGEYALALASELTQRRVACFLDQWGTPPGRELPDSLRRALRGSAMLVLVGTKWAAASDNVHKEVAEFLKTGRPIVPITFVEEDIYSKIQDGSMQDEVAGTLQKAEWYPLIAGVAQSVESMAALTTNQPSASVVSRIVNAEGFTRRSQRLRSAFWTLLVAILLLFGASMGVMKVLRDRAKEAQDSAQRAESRTRTAQHDLGVARVGVKDAQKQLTAATAQLSSVSRKRDEAQAEANRQQEIALIRRLANQADFNLGQGLDSLVLGVSLAVEAANRDDVLGQHSLETDTVLRKSLVLLPRPRLVEVLPEPASAALSPDAQHIAIFNDREKVLKIWSIAAKDGAPSVLHFPTMGSMALSNDARRWAQKGPANRVVEVREVDGHSSWSIDIEERRVSALALSPNGQYLAVGFSNDHDRERFEGGDLYDGYLDIWEVGSRKLIASPRFSGFITANAVSFSPHGNRIAICGTGRSSATDTVGRVLIWRIGKSDNLALADFGGPEELQQPEEINNCAVSEDGKYVATSSRMTLVWARGPDGYTSSSPVARIPLGVRSMAFSADGQTLLTLSHPSAGRTNLEAWSMPDFLSSAEVSKPAKPEGADKAVAWSVLPGEPEFEDLLFRPEQPYASPDERTVVRIVSRRGAEGRTALIYRLEHGLYRRVNSWATDLGPGDLAVRPSRGYLVAQDRRDLRMLEIGTGRDVTPAEIKALDNVYTFKASDDGRWLAVVLEDGEEYVDESGPHRLLLWDVAHSRRVRVVEAAAWIKAYAFSPGGSYLAIGDKSGRVLVFSFIQGTLATVRHYSSIDAMAFSSDERYLATADANGLVIISDLLTHDDIARLEQAGGRDLVFSKDGRYVAGGPASAGKEAWFVRLRDLIEEVCQRVKRFSDGKKIPYCPRSI